MAPFKIWSIDFFGSLSFKEGRGTEKTNQDMRELGIQYKIMQG